MSMKLPEGYEMRFRPFSEFRADVQDDGKITIRGHAATFNDPYNLDHFTEQVGEGAFDEAMKDDVRALLNHDPNHILGRTKSGTLRLSKDKVGLVCEIDLPASAVAVREAVERGDIDQMSFAFKVVKETWDESGDVPARTLDTVKLFDVSPVTFPANPNTDIAMRSLHAIHSAEPKPEAPKVDADSERERLRLASAE